MQCSLYIGSICVLLEDLGFSSRSKPDEHKLMSYYTFMTIHCNKIMADINVIYTMEMFLGPEQLMIDRWRKQQGGLYIVQDGLDLDIADPFSINHAKNFVKETIALALNGAND